MVNSSKESWHRLMSHINFHLYSPNSPSCPWEYMRHVLLVFLVLSVCQVPDWYISAEAGRRAVLQGLRLLEQEQIFPELRVEGQVHLQICIMHHLHSSVKSFVNAIALPVAWCGYPCICKVFVAANEGADHAANATGQHQDAESIRHLQSPSGIMQCWRTHV